MTDFRHRFTRGLAAILPTVLTISIVVWVVQTIDGYIGRYINQLAKWLAQLIWQIRVDEVNAVWQEYHLDVAGFVLAIVLVYIVGLFVASIIGRTAWQGIESLLVRVPVVKQVYPTIKQMTDFLILNENKARFSRVVAVEYPRKGIWSIGLVTNDGLPAVEEIVNRSLLMVFVASTPTPVTGFTIMVPRDEVVDLPLTIDEALRILVSGGVIQPRPRDLPAALGTPLDIVLPAPKEQTALPPNDRALAKEAQP